MLLLLLLLPLLFHHLNQRKDKLSKEKRLKALTKPRFHQMDIMEEYLVPAIGCFFANLNESGINKVIGRL